MQVRLSALGKKCLLLAAARALAAIPTCRSGALAAIHAWNTSPIGPPQPGVSPACLLEWPQGALKASLFIGLGLPAQVVRDMGAPIQHFLVLDGLTGRPCPVAQSLHTP